MQFIFTDRLGRSEDLDALPGEPIGGLLRRHFIPPASVLVTCGGEVMGDAHVPLAGRVYDARLIEGYDIGAIRSRLREASTGGDAFRKSRIVLGVDGDLEVEKADLGGEGIVDHVISTVCDTIRHYDLIGEGDRILVGLSGGVDSSSLLIALKEASRRSPRFELVAATFEDFDSDRSPTFGQAHELANDLGIEHHLVPEGLVQEAFHLSEPLRSILPKLMGTRFAPMAMYIDHHTTRRGLELLAVQQGITKIALGLHTTDLIAGLLNGFAMGYRVGSLPLRRVGRISYIYPLAFIPKRELHLFHYSKRGFLARHSEANAWERNPLDRNYYYYLADMLQEYWPGIEAYIFNSHNLRNAREGAIRMESCSNCGSELLIQPFMPAGVPECEACQILAEAGFRSQARREKLDGPPTREPAGQPRGAGLD